MNKYVILVINLIIFNTICFSHGQFEYQESNKINPNFEEVSFDIIFGTSEYISFGITKFEDSVGTKDYSGLLKISFSEVNSNILYIYYWDLKKSPSIEYIDNDHLDSITIDLAIPEELREKNIKVEIEVIRKLELPIKNFVFFVDSPWTHVGQIQYLNKYFK